MRVADTRGRLVRSTCTEGAAVAALPAPRRLWPAGHDWILFALQAFLVVMVEVGNDIVRGNFWRPSAVEALGNARLIAHFEAAHDLFIEPAAQEFFEQTHSVLGVALTWPSVVLVVNNIYAFCHIFVTLAIAAWVFARHRAVFGRLRNIMLLTNVFALIGYELFPMAPPRLTTGLFYDHHLVHFQDTMRHVLGTGTINGTPIAYNPLSAMPSLHVAWAIIMGATLVLVARRRLLRVVGAIYPVLMTVTVVVTANHFVMDAIGAALAVTLATVVVLAAELAVHAVRSPTRMPAGSLPAGPAGLRT